MTRRATASVVGLGLLAVVLLTAAIVPLPYVIYRPGPTVNLLGKNAKHEIVQVSGGRTVYRDKGALRLLTVSPSGPGDNITLAAALTAWVLPSEAVYRYKDIYQPQETSGRVKEEGSVDMVNSQDSAVAAALHQLGYKFGTSVQVLGIERGGPGDGSLEVRDRLVSVDGAKVTSLPGVVKQIQQVPPGSKVTLVVNRGGKDRTLRIRTVRSEQDKSKSALRISIGRGYELPLDVNLKVDPGIGGPSAGTMFALAIYDSLTPGSLTGGGDVAGTGTIDGAGNVGGIGGIQQKLVGAQRAGAQLFLAPSENCNEVVDGPYDHDKMRVVKIKTLQGAIDALNAWRTNHDAKLPAC